MTRWEITVNVVSLSLTAAVIAYGAYQLRTHRNTPTRDPERAKNLIENADYGVLDKIMKK